VAYGEGEFLVVWADDDDDHIYGARVTPQGVVLDTVSIAISQASASQYYPAVGFDSVNFLVVWEDWRIGSRANIYGARVTPAGTVLDTAGIVITEAADYQFCPAVGFDGVNLMVVWEDHRNGHDANVYGARVTPQGTVLDTAGFVIGQGPDDQCCPVLAFDGANYLTAWADWRSGGDIYGARVTPQGTVLDSTGIVISQAADCQNSPAVAFDGANFLVVWEDRRDSFDVHCARVTPQGTVLDSAGIALSPVAGGQYRPAIAFGDESYLATWDDYRGDENVCGSRVTPEGVVLDSAGICFSQAANDQRFPAIGFDGTNFLLVWQDSRPDSGFGGIYGARVTPQGAVLDPAGFLISPGAYGPRYPAVAFGGTDFLVVWDDVRGRDDWDVFGTRVTPQGTVLDSPGFVISQAANDQWYPALAFNGTDFLVVWHDRRRGGSLDIYGTRVTPQGVVLEPEGMAVSRSEWVECCPAVTSDGSNFFVVWSDWGSGGGNICGARVTPQGTVLDSPGIDISRARSESFSVAPCFDGTNFLVVWEDHRNSGASDIYGARVTPQGTVLDSAGIVISRTANYHWSPSLAYDGTDFLVVWEDHGSGIHGAQVTSGGIVFDGGSVVSLPGRQFCPRLSCGSSSQMFLVYQDWTRTTGGKTYNAYRVWGMIDPNPGVEEAPSDEVRTTNGPTIIRGVFFLPEAVGHKSQAASLLNIAGRKVMELHSGSNDVRALAPGVYFICQGGGSREQGGVGIRKVVLTK